MQLVLNAFNCNPYKCRGDLWKGFYIQHEIVKCYRDIPTTEIKKLYDWSRMTIMALNNLPSDWTRRDIADRNTLSPGGSDGGTLCPGFPDPGCYPENHRKAPCKYSTTLSQLHNLHSDMFRGSALGHKTWQLLSSCQADAL